MTIFPFLRSFAINFALVFIVAAVTTFAYSLIAHGAGAVDWDSAVRLGVIIGISLPLIGKFERKT